jgi:hypothetical protein
MITRFFLQRFSKRFWNFFAGFSIFEIGVFKGHSEVKIENEENLWFFSYIFNFINVVINFLSKIHRTLWDLIDFLSGHLVLLNYLIIIIFYILIFYVLFFLYSVIHNFVVSLRPKNYEKLNSKSLEENPNSVARNLIEESQKVMLKGDSFEKKELMKFVNYVDILLEKVKTGNMSHAEYILYSKLIYMLYFAVNKFDYFHKVTELHEPYKQSLQEVKIIINNAYIIEKRSTNQPKEEDLTKANNLKYNILDEPEKFKK